VPNPQRGRAARAALAAVALTVAVAAESPVHQALGQARAHHIRQVSRQVGLHHHGLATGFGSGPGAG
jgi:hypothetical protein